MQPVPASVQGEIVYVTYPRESVIAIGYPIAQHASPTFTAPEALRSLSSVTPTEKTEDMDDCHPCWTFFFIGSFVFPPLLLVGVFGLCSCSREGRCAGLTSLTVLITLTVLTTAVYMSYT